MPRTLPAVAAWRRRRVISSCWAASLDSASSLNCSRARMAAGVMGGLRAAGRVAHSRQGLVRRGGSCHFQAEGAGRVGCWAPPFFGGGHGMWKLLAAFS